MKNISRQGKYEKKNQMRLPLSAYLIYLLVATLLFTGVSFSKFATTTSGEDSARVAVMAMDTTYSLGEYLYGTPGETKNFTITLTNKEGTKICEVAQKYTMSVESLTNNLALSCEYYKMDGTTETKVDAVSGTFPAGVEETATYIIKITWSGASQPAAKAFEVDALRIVINTEQID